ncbi:MAG: hypothetical protein A2782_01515 [Candidatus Blackburnbacteria bacterium RIFCSPHIGHO2_01_FULL_43_15b]|uniref:Uncharacterized protein n=1 Tax=Candidatus Blackburnbacteria bacterium RIFCSPHIGHO2_01_FULL_43_15b TaxID=1797513 RepID=A0A1G1UXH7_9BACT|nr:MAG: hypothetical protein A2782_01515 [Candidatus Blackburnbacteria bacterium RIFCSPHIGHO2_01_FULL_43_15b]
MVELPHAVVGAAIAYKIGNPALALPLSLLSHFALDLLPHWNPHLNREMKEYGHITKRTQKVIISDVVLSLLAGSYIAYQVHPDLKREVVILLGAFMGVLPDLAEAPFFFFRSKNSFLKRLIGLQTKLQFDIPFWPGVASQVLLLIAAFWWVTS